MSMTGASEGDLLKLYFQNTSWTNVGNAGGLLQSTVAGSIYNSLHTSTGVGTGGSQVTNEAGWTGYIREGVARSSGGWTVTGTNPATAENAAAVTYPACTGAPETDTSFAAGHASSGAGEASWFGNLTSSLAVSSGITPSFAINALQYQIT